MDFVYAVTALALIQFFVFGIFVARARVQSGIAAPAVHGNEIFERYFRIHYNTLEQLVVFMPSLWLFATYISPITAAALGVVYLIGRTMYFLAYRKDPAKRGPGYGLSALPIMIMLLGGLGGAIWSAIR